MNIHYYLVTSLLIHSLLVGAASESKLPLEEAKRAPLQVAVAAAVPSLAEPNVIRDLKTAQALLARVPSAVASSMLEFAGERCTWVKKSEIRGHDIDTGKVSRDGRYLTKLNREKNAVVVLDLIKGIIFRSLTLIRPIESKGFACSDDGEIVAIHDLKRQRILIYRANETDGYTPLHCIQRREGMVLAPCNIVVSGDGSTLAYIESEKGSNSYAMKLYTWNISPEKITLLHALPTSGWNLHLSISYNGGTIVQTAPRSLVDPKGSCIKIFDTKNGVEKEPIEGLISIYSVLSGDGTVLAILNFSNDKVTIVRCQEKPLRCDTLNITLSLHNMELSHDGTLLLSLYDDVVTLCDTRDGSIQKIIKKSQEKTSCYPRWAFLASHSKDVVMYEYDHGFSDQKFYSLSKWVCKIVPGCYESIMTAKEGKDARAICHGIFHDDAGRIVNRGPLKQSIRDLIASYLPSSLTSSAPLTYCPPVKARRI